ncbi:putative acyl-CoA dehydrogenase [Fusarium austroafricanum]|uniref:Putative acyl-CoA dehydrogenase n=1 Tax=Fusarium austroafricanum TaxID=2364996 RepID=A0A8H4KQZ6_9HYPO|nr:putative acyl-CoA dehydrogenase [Fusarium austroafricanum]
MANTTQQVAIPLSEPPWLRGLPSPYFNASHFKLQAACREFIDQHLNRHALEWETAEEVPSHVYQEFAAGGYLVPALPTPLPARWLKVSGITHMPGGIPVEEWDSLHTMIYADEMSRAGLAGPCGAITAGMAYGVPPIVRYAGHQLQERVLPDLLTGRKRACIAITEPEAGSDVANITTVAKRSSCAKFYVVDGFKKWITNGMMADYAVTAVRTGTPEPGGRGISLLLIPLKDYPGVSRRRLKVAGQISAGTTAIEFDNVRVPCENLIGEEGMGMSYIMNNFNHERLFISIGVTRQARVALSTAFAYCLKREAFGKSLIEQPVVRHRLAKCAALIESQTAWVESFSYQLSKMTKEDADKELGGLTALCKANAGVVLDECARCAVLLFGGNGYTRSGQGELIEKIYREVPGARIPGGSEDVLLDLAIRQMVKRFRDQAETKVVMAKI